MLEWFLIKVSVISFTTLCLSEMGHIPVFSLKYPVIIALPLISIYVVVES